VNNLPGVVNERETEFKNLIANTTPLQITEPRHSPHHTGLDISWLSGVSGLDQPLNIGYPSPPSILRDKYRVVPFQRLQKKNQSVPKSPNLASAIAKHTDEVVHHFCSEG